jgi:hypothetical protein
MLDRFTHVRITVVSRARSSADQSTWLRTRGPGVRIPPGAPSFFGKEVFNVTTESTAVIERKPDDNIDVPTAIEFCNACDAMVLPGGYCNCR